MAAGRIIAISRPPGPKTVTPRDSRACPPGPRGQGHGSAGCELPDQSTSRQHVGPSFSKSEIGQGLLMTGVASSS